MNHPDAGPSLPLKIDKVLLLQALQMGLALIASQPSGRNPKIEDISLNDKLTSAHDERDIYAAVADAAVRLGHNWILEQKVPEDEYRTSLDGLPKTGKGSAPGSYRRLSNGHHLFVRRGHAKWEALLHDLGGQADWFIIKKVELE